MQLGLIPVRNFAVVDEKNGLFRSAQPLYQYEYEWLKKVAGIDVIVNLRSESGHDEYFAPNHGMEVKRFMVKDHNEPTQEQANEFICFIQNCIASGKKVLFHCEHGHGRTSTFCVLARLAQGWNLEDALKEETDVFHYSFKHMAQVDFLNKFQKQKVN